MLGAILGDIVGSVYEFNNIVKVTDFPLFKRDSAVTDDTICSIACMDWLLHQDKNPSDILRSWCNGYPSGGYGPLFYQWMTDHDAGPYGSLGNGAVMRISPVALWFKNATKMYEATKKFTCTTHNHEDSIDTTCLLNGLIRLASSGATKDQMLLSCRLYYGEDKMSLTVEDLYNRTPPFFDVTSKGTLHHALICFFQANSFEDAIRYGVSIGGDSDTVCAVIGSLCEARYGFPDEWLEPVFARLSMEMRNIVFEYYSKREVAPKFFDTKLLDIPLHHGWTNPYDNPNNCSSEHICTPEDDN